MSHGRDLLTGRHMDEAEVVRWAAKAFEKEEQPSAPRCWDECTSTSAECETRCVTNAPVADDSVKQGLLVEELAVTWDGRSGLLPDEAFCFVAWGRLSFFGVMAAGGTWLNYFASDGTPIFARPMKAQKQIEGVHSARACPGDTSYAQLWSAWQKELRRLWGLTSCASTYFPMVGLPSSPRFRS